MFSFDLNVSENNVINYPYVLSHSFTFTIKM